MPVRESVPHPEAKTLSDLFALADALLCADRIIERIWAKLPEATRDALSADIEPFNFLSTSQAVRTVADAWQTRIDQGNG